MYPYAIKEAPGVGRGGARRVSRTGGMSKASLPPDRMSSPVQAIGTFEETLRLPEGTTVDLTLPATFEYTLVR